MSEQAEAKTKRKAQVPHSGACAFFLIGYEKVYNES